MPALSAPLSRLIRSGLPAEDLQSLVAEVIEKGMIEERLPVPQSGCSLLTWLIEKRHSQMALRVLAAGADPTHASDAGYQAIHAAAAFNDRAVCQALVKKGASWRAPTAAGATAVHYAFTDTLDPAFAVWVLDQLGSPRHAFMKKSDLGFAAPDTVWVLMARYGRREPEMLEVLKILDERGMIDELMSSPTPSMRAAAKSFEYELLRRFGSGVVGGWWSVRGNGRALEKMTAQIAPPSEPVRRPRF